MCRLYNLEVISHIFAFESSARKLRVKFTTSIYFMPVFTLSHSTLFFLYSIFLIYFTATCPPHSHHNSVLEHLKLLCVLSQFMDFGRVRSSALPSMLYFPSKHINGVKNLLVLLHLRMFHKFNRGISFVSS